MTDPSESEEKRRGIKIPIRTLLRCKRGLLFAKNYTIIYVVSFLTVSRFGKRNGENPNEQPLGQSQIIHRKHTLHRYKNGRFERKRAIKTAAILRFITVIAYQVDGPESDWAEWKKKNNNKNTPPRADRPNFYDDSEIFIARHYVSRRAVGKSLFGSQIRIRRRSFQYIYIYTAIFTVYSTHNGSSACIYDVILMNGVYLNRTDDVYLLCVIIVVSESCILCHKYAIDNATVRFTNRSSEGSV